MADQRVHNFARILVDYSMKIQPGDRVAVTTSTAAESAAQALFALILERGAYPHFLMDMADQEELLLRHASDELLAFSPIFHKMAFEEFDVLIKLKAEANTRSLSGFEPRRQAIRQTSLAKLINAQITRGAQKKLRWMSTIFPTQAYAMDAEMGFQEYQDFFFRACHADEDTPDPVAHWQGIHDMQQRVIDRLEGHDQVVVRGPNADLKLSIKNRKFINASGQHNLPDGEVYTGPVEESVNGWVRYTYPAVYQGRVVEGVELTFDNGQVVKATAEKNQDFLLQMLNMDSGARYLGEFAIGTNYEINRFTRSILFDEKIGGSFHTAIGAGYPETGNTNQSQVHWDMICDLRQDSEVLVDGEVVYRNGQFVFE